MERLPTLCLNMIVKNESKVIQRLLESVADIIDGYCICDTGSTDNTKEIITQFFEQREIPGKIIEEPFRDFGYNRAFALNACSSMEDMDYILLLDADMVLQGNALKSKEELKSMLKLDYYCIYQGSPTYYYKNVRIVKNNRGFSYWGVTHEYVTSPNGASNGTVERDVLFISDIGDGGAKGDKTDRDIRLLEKGLVELPNNDRYTFYLANSYRDARRYQDAIQTYKKRIDIGGWIEEIWQSYYCSGKCYMDMGGRENEIKAISCWMEGYNAYPKRIENVYRIVEYYRNQSKHMLAYQFYCIANESRKKWKDWSDYLFLERDVYDYKLDYEASIVAYYLKESLGWKDYSQGIDFCMKVLNDLNSGGVYNNTMSNYKFYSEKIAKKYTNHLTSQQMKILNSVGDCMNIPDGFVKSTPSVCWVKGYLIVNVRYVNYSIDSAGNYVNKEHITTINVIGKMDVSDPSMWKLIEEFILDYDNEEDGRYVGQEDVRLFYNENTETLYYNANRGLKNGNMCVEHGIIDMNQQTCKQSQMLKYNGRTLEKNWVLVPRSDNDSENLFVYGWYPLVIGNVDENSEFCEKMTIQTPGCFRHVRGSTNGIIVGNEIWFLVHNVSYEDRRYYYHMWIALDKKDYSLKRYSSFFTFEGEKVEYSLGVAFVEKENKIIIGYSVMDRECKFVEYELDCIDSMLIYK